MQVTAKKFKSQGKIMDKKSRKAIARNLYFFGFTLLLGAAYTYADQLISTNPLDNAFVWITISSIIVDKAMEKSNV